MAGHSNTIVETVSSTVEFKHLAGTTLVITYIVMLLGSYTSAIGAGLSCPDWPTCYGTLVPFLHPTIVSNSSYSVWQILAEWAHRGLAMTAGILILGTASVAWRYHQDQPVVVWSALLALFLLPIQVFLGRLTVTQLLKPVIVTSHLGIATLILLCLAVTVVTSWSSGHTDQANQT